MQQQQRVLRQVQEGKEEEERQEEEEQVQVEPKNVTRSAQLIIDKRPEGVTLLLFSFNYIVAGIPYFRGRLVMPGRDLYRSLIRMPIVESGKSIAHIHHTVSTTYFTSLHFTTPSFITSIFSFCFFFLLLSRRRRRRRVSSLLYYDIVCRLYFPLLASRSPSVSSFSSSSTSTIAAFEDAM
jgi:hypothetical protein